MTNYYQTGIPLIQPNQTYFVDQNGQTFLNPQIQPMQYQTVQPTQSNLMQASTSSQMMYQPCNMQQTNTTNNEWQMVNNRKRYRSPEEHQKIQRQTKINEYWLGDSVKTNNIFENLNEETDEGQSNSKKEPTQAKDPRPPPIFITGVANIKPLVSLLDEIAQDQYVLKALGSEQVKVQPKTGESYSNITKALIQKDTHFHTYKPKEDKSYRVVLKNLHHSTDPNEIKNSLGQLGHEAINIWNVKQYNTRKPLPLFFIDLKTKENNKKIFDTKLFMNTSVTFEAPRSKRVIPQCTRCQSFGHTKNFCRRVPRCVKCTESHHTSECPRKTKDNEVKCVNCQENHPANYRGCAVHKQLQQKFYPKLRQRNTNENNIQRTIQPGVTYAQATNQMQEGRYINNTNQQSSIQNQQQNDSLNELKLMMKELITQMGTMMNLITMVVSKLK